MTRLLEIEDCRECIYETKAIRILSEGTIEHYNCYHPEGISGNHIYKKRKIPDWCPLLKAEESD